MLDKFALRVLVSGFWKGGGFEEEAEVLLAKLKEEEVWKQAKNVMIYYPLKDELDLLPLLEDGGKNFYFPKVEGEDLLLYAFDENVLFEAGGFAVNEPVNGVLLEDLGVLDLVIVPGVAFSFAGDRLGRGGGFYDRFLKKLSGLNKHFKTLALALSFQMFEEIPLQEHDVAMDFVLF